MFKHTVTDSPHVAQKAKIAQVHFVGPKIDQINIINAKIQNLFCNFVALCL